MGSSYNVREIVDGSGSKMEVEGRWKWKADGSGRPMKWK